MKARAEEGRVAVRNVRRHIRQELEHLEKDGELSRDELDRIEKDLEKLTHDVIGEIDTMSGHKEKELLGGLTPLVNRRWEPFGGEPAGSRATGLAWKPGGIRT